jgi:hypothetical protein
VDQTVLVVPSTTGKVRVEELKDEGVVVCVLLFRINACLDNSYNIYFVRIS